MANLTLLFSHVASLAELTYSATIVSYLALVRAGLFERRTQALQEVDEGLEEVSVLLRIANDPLQHVKAPLACVEALRSFRYLPFVT